MLYCKFISLEYAWLLLYALKRSDVFQPNEQHQAKLTQEVMFITSFPTLPPHHPKKTLTPLSQKTRLILNKRLIIPTYPQPPRSESIDERLNQLPFTKTTSSQESFTYQVINSKDLTMSHALNKDTLERAHID